MITTTTAPIKLYDPNIYSLTGQYSILTENGEHHLGKVYSTNCHMENQNTIYHQRSLQEFDHEK
jgi:hypothetical protein